MEQVTFIDPNQTPAGPTVVCEVTNIVLHENPDVTRRINKARALMRTFTVKYQPDKKGFTIHDWKDENIVFFVFDKENIQLKTFFDNVVEYKKAKLSIIHPSDAESHLKQYREINGMGTYCFDSEYVQVIKNILSSQISLVSESQYAAKIPVY